MKDGDILQKSTQKTTNDIIIIVRGIAKHDWKMDACN